MRTMWIAILALMSPADAAEYSHGTSYLEPLKYDAGFHHFAFTNPEAPVGGLIRAGEMGTYDSFNHILDKGRVAAGIDMIYDRLLERAIDEPASYYGRLASGVWVEKDFKQIAFKLRDNAYWHDGVPLTAEDVIFTFETMKEKGSAGYRTALMELGSVERIGENEVLFTVKPGASGSPNLVFTIGSIAILPKHYWQTRDITKTTLEPPLGSGPYRVGKFAIGRSIFLDRVDDYWGQDLAVNRGRYNFAQIKFDYFRDENIMLEAVKGDVIDVRHESVSKNWRTGYDFPALTKGYFKKVMLDQV